MHRGGLLLACQLALQHARNPSQLGQPCTSTEAR